MTKLNNKGFLNLDFLNPLFQNLFGQGGGNQGQTVNPFSFMGPQGTMVNYPGSTTQTGGGGFNLGNLIGSLLGGGGGRLDLSSFLKNPAVGAGLLGIGAAQKEPGEIQESRQFLRNVFNSTADPFAQGGLYSQYGPLLEQQEKEALDQVQQRVNAGQPAS